MKKMQKTLLKNSQGLKFGTYFQQKTPKMANFGLKLLKNAPGARNVRFKIFFGSPMCIYKLRRVSEDGGNFIVQIVFMPAIFLLGAGGCKNNPPMPDRVK